MSLIDDLYRQIDELTKKVESLELENSDLTFEVEDLVGEIGFLKKILKDNKIVVRKVTEAQRDKTLFSGNVPIKIPVGMDQKDVEKTIEVGEKIIKWLEDNDIELDSEGDAKDN